MSAITDSLETLRIDMSAATFLDSTALSAIRNKAAASGCALILERPAANVYRLLELTALDGIFTIERG